MACWNSSTMLADEYLEYALRGETHGFSNVSDTLAELYQGVNKSHPCGAGLGLLGVGPSGDIAPCHRFVDSDAHALGHISTGIDREKQTDFLTRGHIDAKYDCHTCWARPLCAGGCHHEAFVRYGDTGHPNLHYCDWIRAGPTPACRSTARSPRRIPDFSSSSPKGRHHETHASRSIKRRAASRAMQSREGRRGRAAGSRRCRAAGRTFPWDARSCSRPGWEVDSAGGTAGLCQPVERDIYDCYVSCFWPAQVPDHLNNSPDWTSKCASATKDWRNSGHGIPITCSIRRNLLRSVFAFLCLSLVSAASAVAAAAAANAGTQLMYLGVWPHTVLVMDAAQGKIVDKINLPTDIARTLVLSPDKSKLYASTVKDNSIVTIDLATRKVTDSFPLNTGNTNYRVGGLAIDPSGKMLYSIATPIVKQIDHFDVNPPVFVTIDLAARKITRMVPSRKMNPFPIAIGDRSKYLPMASCFTCSARISRYTVRPTLSWSRRSSCRKPTDPATDGLSLSPIEDPNEARGKVTGIFETSDPYVHRRIFGIADVDLTNMSYDLTPVGPADATCCR